MPREARMIRTFGMLAALLLAAAAGGCTLLKVNLVQEAQPLVETAISGEGRDKVLVLDITGIILGGESGSPLTAARKPGLLARVREALDRARRDPAVKAVVLRISSPGGGVTPSDILHHELRKFRQETGVVLVAHITDIGTSGAYYAALAADAITAQPTSVNGSIGVLLYRLDATGLMEKVGLRAAEITSGELKGQGSPFRRLSEDERRIFQDFVDRLYDRFTGLVAASRGLPPDDVRKIADGRILTSEEAKAAGLIDSIGYLDDAVELAKGKAGIRTATVVMYHRPGEHRTNIYSLQLITFDLGELAGASAQFLYLWWP